MSALKLSSTSFQSHLGSILPRLGGRGIRRAQTGFNPTLVRFCRSRLMYITYHVPVSIPPWFDFADWTLYLEREIVIGFNPTLVRFCPAREILSRFAASASFNPTLVRFCRSLHRRQ